MLVLITYDVSMDTAAGRKRLHKVAKTCVNWGQRVQNSVFECKVDAAQYAQLKDLYHRSLIWKKTASVFITWETAIIDVLNIWEFVQDMMLKVS